SPTNASIWVACTLDATEMMGLGRARLANLIESLMKDNSNASAGAARRREETDSAPRAPQDHSQSGNGSSFHRNGHAPEQRLNFLSVLDLVVQRWHWLILGGACGAACFYVLGLQLIKPKFTATAQLIRYEAPGRSETFKTAPVSGDTFSAIIQAPELLQDVSQRALPPMSPELFAKSIKVDPDPDSDIVRVELASRDPHRAVDLLNLYITNAVAYTRMLESKQAAVIANEYLKKQLKEMDDDITYLEQQFRSQPTGLHLSNKLAAVGSQVSSLATNAAAAQASMLSFSRQAQKLQDAQAELYDLLLKYTDLHPSVQFKRQQIAEMQHELANAPSNTVFAASTFVPAAGATPDAATPDADILHIKLRTLEDGHQDLIRRQREAELYVNDPPGSVRVFAPASLASTKSNHRRLKTGIATFAGGCLGVGVSLLLVLLLEFMDNRLKTADDVTRVTKLPVLTALGDLKTMEPSERAQWAFRTWTMLQGRLSPSANFGLVCGITSSTHGEGRSTWVNLLAEAASMTGFRVLTIATRPSDTQLPPSHQLTEEDLEQDLPDLNPAPAQGALTTSVLSSPAQVTEKLTGPNSQPVVHIPLPGWVWNLERRKQWREALNQWRQ